MTTQFQPPLTTHESRHQKYYMIGGDLHLVAGDKLFRVHSHFFSRESPYWRDILTGLASSAEVRKRTGSHETNLFDIDEDPEDVADFLWVFYNPKFYVYNTSPRHWATIFRLATKWGFSDVLRLAISHINEILWRSDTDYCPSSSHYDDDDEPHLSIRNTVIHTTLTIVHRTPLFTFGRST